MQCLLYNRCLFRWRITVAIFVVVLGFITVIGSGGGGGGGGVAPVIEDTTLFNDEAAAGILFEFNGDLTFSDADGDLDGGTINYEYGGVIQSIVLPPELRGITSATVMFTLLAQLNNEVGEFIIPCWLIDRAGNRSNTVEISFRQVWTRQYGSAEVDKGMTIARDASDNVIVSGITQGNLDGKTNSGQQDVFVSKYSTDASKQWTVVYGSAQDDVATGVATDVEGNIYVTGFTDGAIFDGQTNTGSSDAFISKLDADGNSVWTVLLGTAAQDKSYGIVVDATNTIFIAGETYGDLEDANNGLNDVFVAAYNTLGIQQWIRQIGTSGSDFARGIVLDGTEGVFIAGGTEGVLGDEDPTPGDPVVNSDAFVAKFDPSGTRVWARQIGTQGAEWAEAVAASDGKAYITGMVLTYAIGSDPALGLRDAFLAGFDTDSSLLFTRQFGGSQYDTGMAVGVDSSNNIYVTGLVNSVYMPVDTDDGKMMLYKFNEQGEDGWNLEIGDATLASQGLGIMINTTNLIYVTGFTEGGLDGHNNAGNADIFIVRFDAMGLKQ